MIFVAHKSDSEIIAEIYRNAQLAITSISDIMPEIEDGEIREEIMREHEEYEKICSEAAQLAIGCASFEAYFFIEIKCIFC